MKVQNGQSKVSAKLSFLLAKTDKQPTTTTYLTFFGSRMQAIGGPPPVTDVIGIGSLKFGGNSWPSGGSRENVGGGIKIAPDIVGVLLLVRLRLALLLGLLLLMMLLLLLWFLLFVWWLMMLVPAKLTTRPTLSISVRRAEKENTRLTSFAKRQIYYIQHGPSKRIGGGECNSQAKLCWATTTFPILVHRQ